MIKSEKLVWQGPFAWPGYEQINNLRVLPDLAGVYLITFEYLNGYILRSLGVTNSMKRRLKEHTRIYKRGGYTLLDVESAQIGLREELWHGWQYARDNQDLSREHKDTILAYAENELLASRLFISDVADKRKRERIEAAILINAYGAKGPGYDLIDGRMALRGRYNYEVPIAVKNVSDHPLYGLPEIFEA